MTLEPPVTLRSYKDKKTGLVVFGVFQIVLGGLAILMLMVTVLGQVAMAHRPEMAGRIDLNSMLLTAAMFVIQATAFIWLGIGSIKARRWARALSLCVGSIGLVCGVVSCVALVWMLPGMDAAMRQSAQQTGQELPAAAILAMKIVMVVSVLVVYIVIPGALVLFYRSRQVKLTCEARDPLVRWTDRCPLPVLAIVLLQAFGGACLLLMLPMYGQAFPFFGLLVQGVPSLAVYLGFGLFSLYAARGFYRLQEKVYWIYVAVMVVFGASGLVSFSGGGLMDYYKAIGLPKAQLRQMEQMPFLHSSDFVWFGVIGAALFLGYLLSLRKYFVAAPAANAMAAS